MPISQSPLQETFGQAPIEAMAAGLPVVVTDWDGCRDAVRHGEDGILVPTLMAPSGEAREGSLRQATSNIYYGTWLSLTVAAEDFQALAADPSLRRRMGAAGQARVKGTFDWAAVIPRYLALWREQQAIRLAVPATGIQSPIRATWTPTKPVPPGRAAPFATRCGYGRTRRRPPPTCCLWSALSRPLCRANGTKLGSLELTS